MKKIVLIKFLFFTTLLFSQNNISYYSNEFGEIKFEVSENFIYIQSDSIENFSDYRIKDKGENFVIIEVNKEIYEEEIEKLKYLYNNVEPVLIYENEYEQVCFDEIIIKPKENNDLYDIFKNFDFKADENEYQENEFIVRLNNVDTYKVFDLINRLYGDNRIEYIEPNFLRFIKLQTNDPYYFQQWAINNQGYLGGTPNADMDVDEAWDFSTGEGIKVAVLDEGIDLFHDDLQLNLLSGFDATGGGSNGHPNINNNDAHGTACAGIIGAIANNNKGITGISYNAKIIPIRIAYSNGKPLNHIDRKWISEDIWLSNAFNWAWQNGADVLSNSWGGFSPSSTINAAINNATSLGRNGKGCVVLFSSGNRNSNSVSYPSSLPNVIAVGASSMCDDRKSPSSCDGENWGSNYGNQLDVIAPGVKIYTTDISGSSGYTSGDYKNDFNGTSAACPNAAGVVALILSVNSNLTGEQARDILQKTTDKISGYSYNTNKSSGTWNNQVGYGRVNAYKAVKEAIFYQTTISGDDTVCDSNGSSSLINLPVNFPYTIHWTSSPNIQIIGNTDGVNISYTVIPNSGQGWVKAVMNGYYEVTKNIDIGIPAYISNAIITGESSICDSYPYTYTLDGVNHPCVNDINWSASGNLTIISSDQNSVTVVRNLSSSDHAGLISANIPNSTTTISKGIWVGLPNTASFDIQKIGTYEFYANEWTKLKTSYTPIMYEQNSPLNLTFEWQIPNSQIRLYRDSSYRDVKPNYEGQLTIGVRSLCECGYSEWKYKNFTVIGNGNGEGPIIIPGD